MKTNPIFIASLFCVGYLLNLSNGYAQLTKKTSSQDYSIKDYKKKKGKSNPVVDSNESVIAATAEEEVLVSSAIFLGTKPTARLN